MKMKKKKTQKSLEYFFSRQRVKEKENGKFLHLVSQALAREARTTHERYKVDLDLESHYYFTISSPRRPLLFHPRKM